MNIYWAGALLLAFIAYTATVYYLGDHAGANRIQSACDENLLKQQQAAISQQTKIQADADLKSATYEQQAAQLRDTVQQTQGRLKNVLAQSGALRACNADDNFLHAYNGVISPTIH